MPAVDAPDLTAPANGGIAGIPRAAWPFLVFGGLSVLGAGAFSRLTPTVVISDGLWVVSLLLAAAGWGAWPVRGLSPETRGCRLFLLAAGLGFGLIGAATLGLGLAGLLSRTSAVALLLVGGALGLGALLRPPALRRGRTVEASRAADSERSLRAAAQLALQFFALTPLLVAATIVLFAATLPPGVVWDSEANAYDVREYHLQVQREYFDAGRITFLPHNVYASFPQQVEILYLLLMHLMGGPYAAALAAQLLHVCFGVLALTALAAWSPAGWPRIITVLMVAATPWLVVVAPLAYVELGVLFYGVLTFALLRDALDPPAAGRVLALAGLCAGFAGGCKYTALVLVAATGGVAWICCTRGGVTARIRGFAIFCAAAALAVSPWLIRSMAFTGNPVFPFAYETFGGAAWSAAQAAQWEAGHAAKLADGGSRAGLAWREGPGHPLFGPAVFGLPLLVLLVNPHRRGAFLLMASLLIGVAWVGLTHLPGRFLIPALAPLGLLIGGGAEFRRINPAWRGLLLGVLAVLAIANAGWQARQTWMLFYAEAESWRAQTGVALGQMVDQTEMLLENDVLNAIGGPADATPSGRGKVWIVGQAAVFYVNAPYAYHVVFNRDPWLAFAADATPTEAVRWLREHDVAYVAFQFSEIERLRRTYGFSDVPTAAFVDRLRAAGMQDADLRDNSQAATGYVVLTVPARGEEPAGTP